MFLVEPFALDLFQFCPRGFSLHRLHLLDFFLLHPDLLVNLLSGNCFLDDSCPEFLDLREVLLLRLVLAQQVDLLVNSGQDVLEYLVTFILAFFDGILSLLIFDAEAIVQSMVII